MGKHKDWKAFADIEVRWIDDENVEVSYRQKESPAYKENNASRCNPNTASRFIT